MGNAAMVCGGGGRGERDAVTVLQADGNVLSYYSRVRVVDLILDYPNHFVCHSSSLVLLQHGKILPLHTLLVPGEVYFLLPMPGAVAGDHHDEEEDESDTSSLLHIEPVRRGVTHRSSTGTMKFVISSEQFSRIMAGSIKDQAGGRQHVGASPGMVMASSSSSKRKRAVRARMVQKTPQPWRPALSSIEEVAAN